MGKAFVPLESNPEVFTELAKSMGLQPTLAFNDVFSIDDPDLLAFVPRPVYALILVFPVSESYEKHRQVEDGQKSEDYYTKIAGTPEQKSLWFRQTIRNACGTYAILHALVNGFAKNDGMLVPDSYIEKLASNIEALDVDERSKLLEGDSELETLHRAVASKGSTEAPDANDSIDLHYVCFTRSARVTGDGKNKENHLVELDGRRNGPIDRGILSDDEDLLSDLALDQIRAFLSREKENPMFSILALSPSQDF